jgi:hypothetical protein
LNFLNSKHDFAKHIDNIQSLSTKIEKKLTTFDAPDVKIDKLSVEELQDINKIVGLANFLLLKYEDKKETRAILQNFVSIITESAQSIESVDDEISELILSAEYSINKVKNMHSKFSDKSDLEKSTLNEFTMDSPKISPINLTNFVTPINTSEYQQNNLENSVQVI